MPVSAAALSIDQLTLTNFRNYERLRLEIGRRHVVLTGPNGAGKTNLFEAISLLAPGRGLRQARYSRSWRGAGPMRGWAIAADVDAAGLVVSLATSYRHWRRRRTAPCAQPPRRRRRHSAEEPRRARPARAGLWLTPAMDRLFSGPPADRRRFLDRLVTADRSRPCRTRVLRLRQAACASATCLLEDRTARPGLARQSRAPVAEAGRGALRGPARISALATLQGHIIPTGRREWRIPLE